MHLYPANVREKKIELSLILKIVKILTKCLVMRTDETVFAEVIIGALVFGNGLSTPIIGGATPQKWFSHTTSGNMIASRNRDENNLLRKGDVVKSQSTAMSYPLW